MKLSTLSTFLSASILLILSGCGAKPTPHEEAITDSTLPKIKLTSNGFKKGMKSIAIEWELVEDKRVKGIYLYKIAMDEDTTQDVDANEYLDTIENRFSTHYLDTDIKPGSKYTYYFKTYSDDAQSVKSKSYVVQSKAILDSVTWIHATDDMPRSAKILWRPHTNKLVNGYEIQRRTLEDEEWQTLVKVNSRLRSEYIDTDLKDKFTYKYRINALTYNGIVSNPSKVVQVITKQLPTTVQNIKATQNKPGKIKITWKKTKINDFLKYNVYRSQSVDGGYELMAEISENHYIDPIDENGKKYFYRVSVLDKDNLESKHDVNSVLGMTLVRPMAPALVKADLVDNKVVIKWDQTDDRTKKYIVAKRYKTGMFAETEDEFDNITNTRFIDENILPDTTYYYKVYAVDVNDIRSSASIEVEFESAEITVADVQEEVVESEPQDEVQETTQEIQEDVITPEIEESSEI